MNYENIQPDTHENVSYIDLNWGYYYPPYNYPPAYYPYAERPPPQQQNYNVVNTNLPRVAKSALYKTELCKNYTKTGFCRYGDMCQFAHGSEQLRKVDKDKQHGTSVSNYDETNSYDEGNRVWNYYPANPKTYESQTKNQLEPVGSNSRKCSTSPNPSYTSYLFFNL